MWFWSLASLAWASNPSRSRLCGSVRERDGFDAPRRMRVLPWCCADETETDQALRRAVQALDDVDLDLGINGGDALDRLRARANERLRSLGALDAPPPPPSPPPAAFSTRSSEETRRAAELAMGARRKRESGELEAEHAAEIRAARSMAQRWLEAGVGARAVKELQRVEIWCSYSTDLGADFHLELAKLVAMAGRPGEAKSILRRVLTADSLSSSLKWRAERALEDLVGAPRPSTTGSANAELGSLFGESVRSLGSEPR